MKLKLTFFALTTLLSAATLFSHPAAETAAKASIAATTEAKRSVTIEGRQVQYTVRSGYLTLKDDEGNDQANVFFTSYTVEGTGKSVRPVTFSFNGGPGSSSVWLHLGVLGPRRVQMTDEGMSMAPPYTLIDNPESWLDLTDLVFIDPVSTGYSRATDPKKEKEYHGVTADIRSVGDFIRRWVSDNKRWNAPKFLIGESYGTTRAAGLSSHLQSRYGMYLNGVILVSAITNFQTAYFTAGNDLPFALFLPTYTATAWYHKKLPAALQSLSLEEVVAKARDFAATDYTLALMKGDALGERERQAVASKLAEFTGLSPEWLLRAGLRPVIFSVVAELLRKEGLSVGRFDSRYTTPMANGNSESSERDASYEPAVLGPFGTLVNDYFTRELGFATHLPYEILTGRVRPWNYDNAQNSFLNTSDDLASALYSNQHLQVWVANGYYDLATPFFATEYTIDHMGLRQQERARITSTYYPAGHMMYLHLPSLQAMRTDAKAFYAKALQAGAGGK